MSSFSRICSRLLVLISISASVGACGFQPLYQSGPSGSAAGDLHTYIWVDAKKTEQDFELANQLRYVLRAGLPLDEIPSHRLTFDAKTEVIQTSIERATGDPRTFTLTLSAEFKLFDLAEESKPQTEDEAKAKPIFSRKLEVRSSYDSTNQRFGRDAAREDAFERSAKEMAHRFHRDLTLFLKRSH